MGNSSMGHSVVQWDACGRLQGHTLWQYGDAKNNNNNVMHLHFNIHHIQSSGPPNTPSPGGTSTPTNHPVAPPAGKMHLLVEALCISLAVVFMYMHTHLLLGTHARKHVHMHTHTHKRLLFSSRLEFLPIAASVRRGWWYRAVHTHVHALPFGL